MYLLEKYWLKPGKPDLYEFLKTSQVFSDFFRKYFLVFQKQRQKEQLLLHINNDVSVWWIKLLKPVNIRGPWVSIFC